MSLSWLFGVSHKTNLQHVRYTNAVPLLRETVENRFDWEWRFYNTQREKQNIPLGLSGAISRFLRIPIRLWRRLKVYLP